MSQKRQKRRGFTLTETVVVLAVIAAIIGLVISVSSSPGVQAKANEATTELYDIVSNVRAYYSGQSVPTNAASVQLFPRTGIFPIGMFRNLTATQTRDVNQIPNNTTAYNPWSGEVTVYILGINGNTPARVQVRFGGIPQPACIRMLMDTSRAARGIGLYQINNVTLFNEQTQTRAEMTAQLARDNCLPPANSKTSPPIDWYFKLAQ